MDEAWSARAVTQTVTRALDILTCLADSRQSLSEVALHLGVHKSTALRLLQTLETRGFVRRDSDRQYRLGTECLVLGQRALDHMDIRSIAAPHLSRLNKITGQTVHLASFEEGEVIYIDKYESRHPIRMYSRIGRQAPLHCTGIAKVTLAFLSPVEREELLPTIDFTPFTDTTITDLRRFSKELEAIRKRGYACDSGEHEELIRCIAAPILGSNGYAIAAASVTTFSAIMELEELAEFLPLLLEVTRSISTECGWRAT